MNSILVDACSPIAADLVRSGLPVPTFSEVEVDSDDSLIVRLVSADGTTTDFDVTLSFTGPEQTAAAADRIQEWVIEEIRQSSHSNWPPCRKHPTSHPLKAIVDTTGRKAVWVCPRTNEELGIIGQLIVDEP